MNIEIANRLVELRKKHGYSQEELADKLGISRQAVSKWERAESSPDTDNLICLAKLYNISLDELLDSSQDAVEIRRDVIEREQEKNGGAPRSDAFSVPPEKDKKRYRLYNQIEGTVSAVSFPLVTIIYFLVSFLDPNQWGKLWVIFMIPVFAISIVSCIKKRRVKHFAYPVFAAFVYLFLGMYFGLWHPSWILFITVPVFYIIAEPIDRATAERRKEAVDPDDDDD